MAKKLCALFLLGCFMASVLPMQAWSSPHKSQKAALKKLIMILQGSAEAGAYGDDYYTSASLRTQILLNDLLRAVDNANNKKLTRLVENYVSDMALLQDEAQINPQCLLYLGSAFSGISSLINTFSAEGVAACLMADLVAEVGNILSALQSYRICEIVYSETPDQALCQQIVKRQTLVKICSYIAKVFTVFYCTSIPSASDYLSLVLGLWGIFPRNNVCMPPAAESKN